MEALQSLEKVQAMLSFMQRQGISSHDTHSDRFLADFLLFMMQPYTALNMEKKYHLILEHLPKIPSTILEEALVYNIEEDYEGKNDLSMSGNFENEGKHLPGTKLNILPMVGLEAMQQANSSLEDFCRSYFMFHGMDANKPHCIFQFLPILSFVESYIYQLDMMNEDGLSSWKLLNCSDAFNANKGFVEMSNDILGAPKYNSTFGAFAPLLHILRSHGLLTERMSREFDFGIEYWSLERKLCKALLNKCTQISIEDVQRAIHLKSFDYRVLNLLLCNLRGEQVHELHMTFLSVSELLVEISDDLYDYEDDVIKNSFNILRMFVKVYGASAAPGMLAKYITEAEDKLKMLVEGLDPKLRSEYWRRCKEAAEEGGRPSAHVFGTWNIPRVIADEEGYRSNYWRSKSTIVSV